MARANIKILLLIVVQIAPMGKNRPVQLIRTVKIVVQGNTVFQPNYVKIADQDNIVAVQQIVNVILAPRVDIHRDLVIQCVHHVVQANIKIRLMLQVQVHVYRVKMGQYQH